MHTDYCKSIILRNNGTGSVRDGRVAPVRRAVPAAETGEVPVVGGLERGPVVLVVLLALEDGGGRSVEVELSPKIVLGAQHSARLEETVRGLADVCPGAQVARPAVATLIARSASAASSTEPLKNWKLFLPNLKLIKETGEKNTYMP